MNTSTIRKLNQLNRTFYEQVADDFDQSRNHFWPGWYQFKPLLEELKAKKAKVPVLDLGCGNGRWAEFLAEHLLPGQIIYTGTDTNLQFLEITRQKLDSCQISHTVFQQDMVESLLNLSFLSAFEQSNFSIISLLGVIHHLPSFDLRQQLLLNCISLLKTGGILIVASWQFLDFERFTKKIVDQIEILSQLKLDPDELDPDDYFMTWERGVSSLRYCHYTTKSEILELLEPALEDKQIEITQTFRADGKENAANLYLVIKKL